MAMTEEAEGKVYAVEIKELGDKIVALTLLQARQLADYLKEVHGIEPAAGAVTVAAVAGGGAGASAAAEEKTAFDVILADVGPKKIQVIKTVREITNLGLKEAKALVDGAPKPVKEGATKEEAAEIKKKLEAEGAKVEVK
jgi:large subunit ribosomal protein L7/L12